MEKRIKVSGEVRRMIKKVFGVSDAMVSYALNYNGRKGQTEKAARMRVMALKNGGVTMVTVPECETIHNEVDGTMVQTFGNGARLVLNKKTSYGVIYYPNGEKHLGLANVTLHQIGVMQEIAAAL